MSINLVQAKKVIERLATDETWKQVTPEIQKALINDLYEEIAFAILEGHIEAVLKEGKRRGGRKKAQAQEPNEQ